MRQLATVRVEFAPGTADRSQHLESLLTMCDSQLEKDWLGFLNERDLRLPTRAQAVIKACGTKPDFLYDESSAAIYIDGPPHDFPDRQKRDELTTEQMRDYGYTVIRFRHFDDWQEIVARYPSIFGRVR